MVTFSGVGVALNNLISIIISANDNASSVIKNVTGVLDGIGEKITRAGVAMTAATAIITAGLGASVHQAVQFDEAMTNVGAVLGKGAEEMRELNAEVLRIGGAARAGPQAAAAAFYDIVGGVADASTHMAILNAAIATSEAGAASLTGTTSALIAVMNSYAFSADKATYASDVLTQTVGMGVGSMEELAAAIPQVAGLAAQAGIDFADLGAQIAFLTTKGFSFSQASTQVRAAIVALLTPNAKMLELFKAAGIESGSAAIQAHGLAGAYDLVSRAANGSQDELARAVGSVEALNAVMALGQEGFEGFADTFKSGLEGATEAAREIQRMSAAFQLDLLKSSFQELGITIGMALLPALNKIVGAITPIVRAVSEWLQAHPRLTTVLVAFAVALSTAGPLLIGVGTVMKSVTLATTGLSAALKIVPMLLAAITSPVALVIGALALLATVLGVDLLGGFRAIGDEIGKFVDDIGERGVVGALLGMVRGFEDGSGAVYNILRAFGVGEETALSFGQAIYRIVSFVQAVVMALTGDLIGAIETFGDAAQQPAAFEAFAIVLFNIGNKIRAFITDVQIAFSLLPFYAQYYFGMIWSRVQPVVQPLIDWITGDGEDSLSGAITSIANAVDAYIIKPLQGIWVLIEPHVQSIIDWFNNDLQHALRSAEKWIYENITVRLQEIWATVQPYLEPIVEWFKDRFAEIEVYIAPVFQRISDFIDNLRIALTLLNLLGGGTGLPTVNPRWGDLVGEIGNPGSGGGSGKFPPLVDPRGKILRDMGGRGMPGQMYLIGSGAQPELFIPDSAGTFVPNADRGGRSVSLYGDVNLNLPNVTNETLAEEFRVIVYEVLEDLGSEA